MISLLFAVDHEAALVREALSDTDSFQVSQLTCVVGAYAGEQISIGLMGMGGASAGQQAAIFMNYFQSRFIILAGYSGALVPHLSRGEVVLAENYSSAPALHLPQGLKRGQLVSVSDVVCKRADREALHGKTKAMMVDMETSSVAAEVTRANIPFLVVRAISDGLDDDLPSKALSSAYDPIRQQPTPLRLLYHLAAHPGDIGSFSRFVSGLTSARKALTQTVLEIIRLNQAGLSPTQSYPCAFQR